MLRGSYGNPLIRCFSERMMIVNKIAKKQISLYTKIVTYKSLSTMRRVKTMEKEYKIIEAIEVLQKNKPHGKTILIKGSNGIKLSTVIDYL
mgnify:CR=1 FL=1